MQIQTAQAAAPQPKPASRINITRGPVKKPFRVLIYGEEKVGKSTFALGAPSPIFISLDRGTEHMDIARFDQPTTWEEAIDLVRFATRESKTQGFETLVIDPVNYLEPLAAEFVLRGTGKTLDTYGGGYGKGHNAVADKFREFLKECERAWESGLNVLFVAHCDVKKFKNPAGDDWQRFAPALTERNAAELKRWVDANLFATHEVFAKDGKAFGNGARVIHTVPNPAYDAGNRWNLPPKISLSWTEFWDAKHGAEARSVELKALIESGLAEIANAEYEKKVRNAIATGMALDEIANRVSLKVAERRSQQ